ncbi:group 3 secretory phospholipase A2 [Esox lucius]|uniref:phospholipase A2 n=1 Tax=Esox lucius TaxID=8010 RepID=A0A6Q2ZIN6_ESOLU|nr:group 3 secretory phospholipase A2 [Esox lucius]
MINTGIQQFILCVSLFSLLSTHDVKMSTGTDAQSIFCHKTSATGVGHTLISFLRNVVGSQTLLLYVSKWSKNQPVKCSINEDLLATSSYLTLCRQTHSESPVELSHFNISKLLSPGNLCSLSPVNGFSTQPESDILEQHLLRAKSRRKRALIFPGTLWCGTGSKAIDYHQLGMFERADRCCREHDHCGSIIPSFTVNYGVFNSNFFTVSHCECDQRFRQCLQSVNDSISNMVGFSFFNLLRVPCFEFTPKSQCIELNWWGMCKVAKVAPYAVLKKSLVYTINHTDSKYGTSSELQSSADTGTDLVTVSPLSSTGTRKIPKGNRPKSIASTQDCVPRGPPRGDTFQTEHRLGKRCNRGKKTSATQTNKHPTKTNKQLMTVSKKTASTTKTTASKSNTGYELKMTKTAKQKTGSTTEKTTFSSQQKQAVSQKARSETTYLATSTSRLKPSPQSQKTSLTITTALPKHAKAPHGCRPRAPPRGDSFQTRQWRGRRGKACLEPTASKPPSPTNMSLPKKTASVIWRTTFQTQNTIPVNETTSPPVITTPTHWNNTCKRATTIRTTTVLQTPTESASAWTTDSLLLCGTLKHLDDCKYKIPPLEKRYDLHNVESKTVYHCDCTRRLAGLIRDLESPSILISILQDFVSPLCLSMSSAKYCHGGKSCTAGFSKAFDLIQVYESMEERERLAQSTSKNKKRGMPVRLYKRCLRITEPRTHRLI